LFVDHSNDIESDLAERRQAVAQEQYFATSEKELLPD
jgi:hypothetical protein